MKHYWLLLLICICVSCEKEAEPTTASTFDVQVAGVGIDCKRILIEFQQQDLPRIERITGSPWERYHAFNLQDEDNQTGQMLRVTV